MLETRRRTVRLKAEDDNVIADQNVSMTLRTTLSSSCSGPSGLLFCSMRSIFGSPERDWWATTSSFTIKSALNLHPVVLVFRVKPNPCSSVPGGTGHRPVLSGDSPDSRAPTRALNGGRPLCARLGGNMPPRTAKLAVPPGPTASFRFSPLEGPKEYAVELPEKMWRCLRVNNSGNPVSVRIA